MSALAKVAAGVICGLVFAKLTHVTTSVPFARLSTIALLACIILPDAWVVRQAEHDRILPTLLEMIARLPRSLARRLIRSTVSRVALDRVADSRKRIA